MIDQLPFSIIFIFFCIYLVSSFAPSDQKASFFLDSSFSDAAALENGRVLAVTFKNESESGHTAYWVRCIVMEGSESSSPTTGNLASEDILLDEVALWPSPPHSIVAIPGGLIATYADGSWDSTPHTFSIWSRIFHGSCLQTSWTASQKFRLFEGTFREDSYCLKGTQRVVRFPMSTLGGGKLVVPLSVKTYFGRCYGMNVMTPSGPSLLYLHVPVKLFDYSSGSLSLLSEKTIDTEGINEIFYAEPLRLADGGFVVVFGGGDSAHYGYGAAGVYLQRFSASGEKKGGRIVVNVPHYNDVFDPTHGIAHFKSGLNEFLITWTENNNDDVYGQLYRYTSEEISPIGGNHRLNSYTHNRQFYCSVAAMESGFVAVWTSCYGCSGYSPSADHRLIAQQFHYDPQWGKIGSEINLLPSQQIPQTRPLVIALSENRYVVLGVDRGARSYMRAGCFGDHSFCCWTQLCSRHGSCFVDDEQIEMCRCDFGYYSQDCSEWNCSRMNKCSQHGTCVSPQTCACDPSFSEKDCSKKKADSALADPKTALLVLGVTVSILVSIVCFVMIFLLVACGVLRLKRRRAISSNERPYDALKEESPGSSAELPDSLMLVGCLENGEGGSLKKRLLLEEKTIPCLLGKIEEAFPSIVGMNLTLQDRLECDISTNRDVGVLLSEDVVLIRRIDPKQEG